METQNTPFFVSYCIYEAVENATGKVFKTGLKYDISLLVDALNQRTLMGYSSQRYSVRERNVKSVSDLLLLQKAILDSGLCIAETDFKTSVDELLNTSVGYSL